MSLHTLANHLQSAGRGQDSVLVHMTPGEVNGLQSLAMAHGGSLTINPETGLPEAGILSALLPIAAGFFLGPAGLQLTAMQSALAVGALGTAATGSLGKGLMMGFGAYGGAGLGEGLMNAGASAMPNAGAGAANAQGAAAVNNASSSYSGLDKIAPTTTTASNTAASTLNPVANSGAFTGYQSSSLAQGPFANTAVNASSSPAIVNSLPSAPAAVIPKPPVDVFAAGPNASINAPIQTALAPPPVTPLAVTPPAVTPPPVTAPAAPVSNFDKVGAGLRDVTSSGTKAWEFVKAHPTPFIGLGVGALQEMQEQKAKDAAAAAGSGSGSPGMIRPYEMSVAQNQSAYAPNASTAERQYFVQPRYIPKTPYAVAKEGGLMGIKRYAVGGAVEQMSAQNAVGDNTMYPQSQLQTPMYSNPMVQRPMPTNVISMGVDAPVDRYTGEMRMADGGITANYPMMEQQLAVQGMQMQSQGLADGGMAGGGYNLGGYSDGGRLLRGPGDGVSDSIPASIGNRQPARLADGEFVVPARIVSEIGNGSTEAGARKLYAMMDRVQKARGKTVGKNKVAVNTKAEKLLPA